MFITIYDGKEIQIPITSKNGLSNIMALKMQFVSKVHIGEENTSMAKILAVNMAKNIYVVGWR